MAQDLATLTTPSYLATLIAANPALAHINDEALSGSAKPMPPSIIADKGKFVIKQDGNSVVATFPDTPANQAAGIVGAPLSVLKVIVLKAKPGIEKAWYAETYVPGQEAQAPDCSSEDGVKPSANSSIKQCDNCASCPQNVFGSGKKADGSPSGGKACNDKKIIAVYAVGFGVYRFAIPPASLTGKRASGLGMSWDMYCRQLASKGLPLPAVITTISFDRGDTDYKLNFNFDGVLAEAQLSKIIPMIDTAEVQEIVLPRGALQALSAPSQPIAQIENSNVVNLDDEREKKELAEKAQAKAAEIDKKAKAAAAKAKKEAEAAAKVNPPIDDLGLDIEDALIVPTKSDDAPAAAPAVASDDDLINSLGL